MAMVLLQTLPEGATLEQAMEVSAEMDVSLNPPEGLIVHTLIEDEGRIKVVDVWESEEQYNDFVQGRLTPAVATVVARRGVDPINMPMPDSRIFEAHDVVKGA